MKYLNVLFICLIMFQMTACNYVKTSHIDKDFNRLLKAIKKDDESTIRQDQYQIGLQIQNAIEKSKEVLNHRPKLEGRMTEVVKESEVFVEKNTEILEAWSKKIEARQKALLDIIQLLGQRNHDMIFEGKMALSPRDLAINESLIFFTLQYMRELNDKHMLAVMPLSLASLRKEFDKNDTIQVFRDKVLDKYLTLVGVTKVIQRDMEKTLWKLSKLKEHNVSPDFVNENLGRHLNRVAKRESGKQEQFQHMHDDMDDEQKSKYEELKSEYEQKLAGLSFLYDPNNTNKDSFLMDALVIIGNLTWGMVNTAIGLGAVLGTMIISPFTRYVDFPTFAISASEQQIYVDVSGMGPIPGKMSLGLFELDNHSGYYFASGHEAGHAKQSALLGPMYLPMVLLSYAISGHSGSFMERWADVWATTLD
ncbi:MAG: hypothetical protein EP326_08615 [Deltaproteobacteria bacterium]|nr:MAG: hypothetical protein EP326_08615 [Deltaproteobacteria bacterium]